MKHIKGHDRSREQHKRIMHNALKYVDKIK
jgi:hypothetical protein